MTMGLGVLARQFIKNFGEPPGWVPLLITAYIVLEIAGAPSSEVLASAATIILYQFGDALDAWLFKDPKTRRTRDRFDRQYKKERARAQTVLGIDGGIRDVALKLADVAEKSGPVHRRNEFAKFIRSLVLPLFVLVFVFPTRGQAIMAVPALAGTLIATYLYLQFKIWHLHLLYELIPGLVKAGMETNAYKPVELEGVRLFFWDGNLVASAVKADHIS